MSNDEFNLQNYNEWDDDYEAPAINYDIYLPFAGKARTEDIITLTDDSSNSSSKTVEYNFQSLEHTSGTFDSGHEGLSSKLLKNSSNSEDVVFEDICLQMPKFCKLASSITAISDSQCRNFSLTQPSKKKKTDDSKEEKIRQKIERDRIKEIKKNELLKEKQIKSMLSTQQKSLKPEEVIKRITVHVDVNVLNCSCGSLIIPALQKENINYKVEALKEKNIITWTKSLMEPYVNEAEKVSLIETESVENVMLEIMTWKTLIDLIAGHMLTGHINSLKDNEAQRLTIVILELEKYFKFHTNTVNRAIKASITGSQQQKSKKSEREMEEAPKLSREEIEMALMEVQLLTNTCHRKIENSEDLANLVFHITRSISQIDSKRERNDKDQQTLSWFAKADSKCGVSVDKNGNGLLQLWQQQLCQFNNVGLEVAQAIIGKYSSPRSLLAAYAECGDVKEAEDLLADIMIRREAGILSSSRKVGCELSKKIHRFFTASNSQSVV